MRTAPFASTAHRGAIRELVALSGLRARLRFRSGDVGAAIDDVLAGMAAARHLSMDGSLASVLFAYSSENAVALVLVHNLYRVSRSDLQRLAPRLKSLPSGFRMREALEAEKVRRDDLQVLVQGARNRKELTDDLLNGVPFIQRNLALTTEIVDGCGGTVQGFAGCLEQQRVFYRRWVSRFTLRPEQFEMQYKVSAEKLGATNSLIRYLTPDIPRLRWAEADALTRRALLETALDVELPSNSALGRHLDPYDGKTFSWRVMDGGFRLDSRLKEGGTPLSISVHSDQSHAQ